MCDLSCSACQLLRLITACFRCHHYHLGRQNREARPECRTSAPLLAFMLFFMPNVKDSGSPLLFTCEILESSCRVVDVLRRALGRQGFPELDPKPVRDLPADETRFITGSVYRQPLQISGISGLEYNESGGLQTHSQDIANAGTIGSTRTLSGRPCSERHDLVLSTRSTRSLAS